MKRLILGFFLTWSAMGVLYADVPDTLQNSGSDNMAYDLPEKWYVGINAGYSLFGSTNLNNGKTRQSLGGNSSDWGAFAGYKFGPYFSLEANFQQLGILHSQTGQASYHANVQNLSLESTGSYPLISGWRYGANLYGQLGYGLNLTHFNYSLNNGTPPNSGSMNHGVFNFGLGVSVDFRQNISARLGYNFYRVYYPLPGCGNKHELGLFNMGLYYNFA